MLAMNPTPQESFSKEGWCKPWLTWSSSNLCQPFEGKNIYKVKLPFAEINSVESGFFEKSFGDRQQTVPKTFVEHTQFDRDVNVLK